MLKKLLIAAGFILAAALFWFMLQSFATNPFPSDTDPNDHIRPFHEQMQACALAGGTWNSYTSTCDK